MTHADTDRLESTLNAFIDRTSPPGLGTAVVQGGQLTFLLEHGYADLKRELPLTAQTRFPLNGLTQVITAAAVLHLADSGRIGLGDAANQHLNFFAINAPSPVTVRHLLTHTAGLGTARSIRALVRQDGRVALDRPAPSLADFYGGSLKTAAPPGDKWCYSADGYAALGQLIEDVTDTPLGDCLGEAVFAPFGMENTVIGAGDRSSLAVGYRKHGARYASVAHTQAVQVGGLGATSTLDDLTKLVAGLMAGDSWTAMFQPGFQLHPRLSAMGLGFMLQPRGDEFIAWHSGKGDGFSVTCWLAPAAQTGVILWTNHACDGLDATARATLLSLLDDAQTEPTPSTPAQTDLKALTAYYAPSPGLLTNLTLWKSFGGGVTIRTKRDGLRISGQIDPATSRPLLPTGDPAIFRHGSADGPLVIFERDRVLIGLYTLYRRSFWHSLGGKLALFVVGAFVAFMLVLLLIASL